MFKTYKVIVIYKNYIKRNPNIIINKLFNFKYYFKSKEYNIKQYNNEYVDAIIYNETLIYNCTNISYSSKLSFDDAIKLINKSSKYNYTTYEIFNF